MPSAQQIIVWRKQAADKLFSLITSYSGDDYKPGDYKADDLLRSLNKLPARPADRAPYKGMFPNLSASEGRKQAASLLKKLVVGIAGNDFQPVDGLVDDLARLLLNLPQRPATRQPYAGVFPEAKFPQLSVAQLRQIIPYADANRVNALYPFLLITMVEADITTPLRQAHFIAQLAHESGSFNYLEEIASGEDYEGRDDLGNTQPGDGRRFKGRGLIQITGRSNYFNCGEALGVDLIANPTRLANHDLACYSAGWFWETNQINPAADRDDVERVTRIINGGLNGFADRKEFLAVAKQVLRV